MRSTISSFFIFALLLLESTVAHSSTTSFAQTGPDASSRAGAKSYDAKVSGNVVDSSGAMIGGAIVQIQTAHCTDLQETRSDLNGFFLLAELSFGDYLLSVSSSGFEPRTIPVTLRTDGTPTSLRISLEISSATTSVEVQGRKDDLTGIANSSTQGTVGALELQERPLLRSGEVLETVPGVIITQHAGGGKANQYFLRGFNLDHGTDFAVFVDDVPLNLPSHAHGEGYSDMNTVIPEFVKRVNFEKGPYYADVGDFGGAGSAHLELFKTLPRNFFRVEGGQDGYGRLVFGVSQKLGSGDFLYGGEAYHDDGPWLYPDNYYKLNGLATYSQSKDSDGFSIATGERGIQAIRCQ